MLINISSMKFYELFKVSGAGVGKINHTPEYPRTRTVEALYTVLEKTLKRLLLQRHFSVDIPVSVITDKETWS